MPLKFTAPFVALLAATSVAEARPDTRSMTCQQVQTLLERQGATVLTTGTHTYDRYLPQFSTQCRQFEEPRQTSVPTSDTSSCRVFECQPIERLFGNDRD